jgi:hypothetical protein
MLVETTTVTSVLTPPPRAILFILLGWKSFQDLAVAYCRRMSDSPVPHAELQAAAQAFGVAIGAIRDQLYALNGSVLLLAQDEMRRYWTYKHPTVSDDFAHYVAKDAELVEIYLRGAKCESSFAKWSVRVSRCMAHPS